MSIPRDVTLSAHLDGANHSAHRQCKREHDPRGSGNSSPCPNGGYRDQDRLAMEKGDLRNALQE